MTWYNVRHGLIWFTGIMGAFFGAAVLIDVPMLINGSLDPFLMLADICTAGFFWAFFYGLYDAQRAEDYAPRDRTKQN